MDWPFDQAPNVAAITTRQVTDDNFPILSVVHYADDHSWAFTCGTSNESQDARIVGMGQVSQLDATIFEIASLPPSWGATRAEVGGAWHTYEMPAS
jgi:hypothetical protein